MNKSTLSLNYTKENFSEYNSVYLLFSKLIKNQKNQYIPYFSLQPNKVIIRKNLPDNQRFDSQLFTTDNTVKDINTILQNGINWLYQNVWKENYIHGDLTSNNLILLKKQLYFIDWKGTTEQFNSKYKCLITIFILSDIVDYLNSFYERFPILVQIPDFNDYYNIIKNIEYEIKSNPFNCHDLYIINQNKITDFIFIINKMYHIPMNKFSVLGKRIQSFSFENKTKKRRHKSSNDSK
jgi:serine/threonine-protein kinase RIO1